MRIATTESIELDSILFNAWHNIQINYIKPCQKKHKIDKFLGCEFDCPERKTCILKENSDKLWDSYHEIIKAIEEQKAIEEEKDAK